MGWTAQVQGPADAEAPGRSPGGLGEGLARILPTPDGCKPAAHLSHRSHTCIHTRHLHLLTLVLACHTMLTPILTFVIYTHTCKHTHHTLIHTLTPHTYIHSDIYHICTHTPVTPTLTCHTLTPAPTLT